MWPVGMQPTNTTGLTLVLTLPPLSQVMRLLDSAEEQRGPGTTGLHPALPSGFGFADTVIIIIAAASGKVRARHLLRYPGEVQVHQFP
jgi:hypothetical protein